jgi:hypothetical protein
MIVKLKVRNEGAFSFNVFEEYSFWLCKAKVVRVFCARCTFVVRIALYTSWREFCSAN